MFLIPDLEVRVLLVKIHFSTSLGRKKVSCSTSQNGHKSAVLCTECGSLMWVSLFLCYLQLLKPNKYWFLFENSSLLCCASLCVCAPWIIVYCYSVLYFIAHSLALTFALRSAEVFLELTQLWEGANKEFIKPGPTGLSLQCAKIPLVQRSVTQRCLWGSLNQFGMFRGKKKGTFGCRGRNSAMDV